MFVTLKITGRKGTEIILVTARITSDCLLVAFGFCPPIILSTQMIPLIIAPTACNHFPCPHGVVTVKYPLWNERLP